ncbi:recombinase family protein [Micromonospora sp. NPDC049033]|uniref:recombinase family protein n=1 Tax=Micromonospora sp. NPDC049033 TaxID=3155149 RepID=UPI0033C6115B
MRAAIYTRVSSDPRETGRSVEEQEAECRQVCERQGWTVARVFCDNDRGASRHSKRARPKYQALREFLVEGGADVLVLWEGSRAQRDLADYLSLRDLCAGQGILYSYSGRTYDLSRTDDRFNTALDALLAEREADVTRDRILRAVRANAAAGRPHGKLLYGYSREYDERGTFVRQVINEGQAAVIREAARRVAAGEPCRAIALDFNARGIAAPRGGSWDLTQVRRVVINPAYIGQRVHRGVVVGEGQWPAILTEADYINCKVRMTDPRRKSVRDTTVKHSLSGAARCGVCGSRMRVQKNRTHFAYICIKGFCVSVKTTNLEEFVDAVIVERLSRPDVIKLLAAPAQDDDARTAQAEADELRARLDEFYAASAAGEISPGGLAKIEGRLLGEIEAAERRAYAAQVPQILKEVARPDIGDVWHGLPVALRREVIDLLMVVKVHPTGRGQRTFRPERVEIEWKH